MLRSPVPLLFLIAIVVVNLAESSPVVQLQVPGSTSSVPNDTIAWTKFGSLLAIAAATTVLFFTVLGALFVECNNGERELLLIPKFKAIFYLHAFFGYVALLCVGIASHLGAAACLSGNDSLFILGGAFLCFVGMWALLLHEQKFLKDIKPDIFASLYGHMLIAYIGVVGNLSLVGFGGPFAVLSAAAFALYCIGMLVYRPWK
uniref:Cytochrome b561 domain-containing protein n=1 Tax=Globodera pallida TaxID=36090 RepID=A0A183CDY7_GLOPA